MGWVEYETLIDPFTILKAVDFGDAGMDPYNQSRTLEEIRVITREIAETGAIPFAIGGDHSVPNATYRATVDVYGRKNVGFLHFGPMPVASVRQRPCVLSLSLTLLRIG